MIRAELNIVLPREPALTTAEEIRNFIITKFLVTRTYVEKYTQCTAAGQVYTNLYPSTLPPPPRARPVVTADQVGVNTQQANETAPADPEMAIDPDGSFIMEGITVRGIEYGTVGYETAVTYTGRLRIPGDIAAQGREAVQEFIRRMTGELEENTDNYIYGEGPNNTGTWNISRVNIQEVNINNAMLDAAARRRRGEPVTTPAATPRRTTPSGPVAVHV